MTNNAAILAIGSELLSGQITNRNASWLSRELFNFGISTDLHLVVDDVKEQITEWVDAASQSCNHVFITGGLGPTVDDLTRDAISDWCGEELEFHEESWEHVKSIFAKINRPVPVSNKQQCYFPKGSRIITNHAGTANAFYLEYKGNHIWVLPGPPHEIEVVWEDHIKEQLSAMHKGLGGNIVRNWRVVGMGESSLAEIVDPIVQGSGAELSYRAHAPYVEIKIRYPFEKAEEFRALRTALHNVLEPWLFEVDGENKAKELSQLLESRSSAWIYDSLSEGYLNQLLANSLRNTSLRDGSFSFVNCFEDTEDPEEFLKECITWTEDVEIALAVAGFYDSGEWSIAVKQGDDVVIKTFPSPFQGEALRRRNQHAIAALAIKEWLAVLKTQLQH